MTIADRYHKWVEWSDEDGLYIGQCPDLFYGGCHGADPVKVYAELLEIVAEVVADYEKDGKPLPAVKIRPLPALAAA
jgi:predicted RNase H-like HicB family nuclease